MEGNRFIMADFPFSYFLLYDIVIGPPILQMELSQTVGFQRQLLTFSLLVSFKIVYNCSRDY